MINIIYKFNTVLLSGALQKDFGSYTKCSASDQTNNFFGQVLIADQVGVCYVSPGWL